MTLTNKENLKSQATMFIRKLVEFTNTLDVPPPDKWISMVLTVSYTHVYTKHVYMLLYYYTIPCIILHSYTHCSIPLICISIHLNMYTLLYSIILCNIVYTSICSIPMVRPTAMSPSTFSPATPAPSTSVSWPSRSRST